MEDPCNLSVDINGTGIYYINTLVFTEIFLVDYVFTAVRRGTIA